MEVVVVYIVLVEGVIVVKIMQGQAPRYVKYLTGGSGGSGGSSGKVEKQDGR